MRSVLVSLWNWFAIATLIVAWVPMMAVVWLFDRDPVRYRTGLFLRRLGRTLTYVNPLWDIEVDGAFPDDPRAPYVVVSNHLSQGDPPIIARVPWEMKWVAKAELFDLPFAGWLLRMSGDIPVDRRSRSSRTRVLVRAREYLRNRCSVMFFPEGTRSPDGRVHRFADGAFRLAIQEGVPVLPIAIDGTRDALPKHSVWFRPDPQTIRVRVLEPVDTSAYDPDDARSLQAEVRRRIVEQVAAWRDTSPADVDALADAEDADVEDVEDADIEGADAADADAANQPSAEPTEASDEANEEATARAGAHDEAAGPRRAGGDGAASDADRTSSNADRSPQG
jgi:1-acyl-sn-glycerol-3-phosphate acyltransferase